MKQQFNRKRQKRVLPYLGTILGIILYFFLLELLWDSQKTLSSLFFSLSWITLVIGILFLMSKKWCIRLWIGSSITWNLIIYIEYVFFKAENYFVPITQFGQETVRRHLLQADNKLLITILLTTILIIVVAYSIHKIENWSISKIDRILLVLLIMFIVISSRAIAIQDLGPQIIATSGKEYNSPKNIFLNTTWDKKKMDTVGFYEMFHQSMKKEIGEKIRQNWHQIQNKQG